MITSKQKTDRKSHDLNGWRQVEPRLLAERARVLAVLAVDSMSPDELVNGWQERDSASEDEIRDLEYMHRGTLRQQIIRIDRALERIKAGTYGLCSRCGEMINRRRLTDEPGAEFCLACQKIFEGVAASSTM